MSDTFRSTAKSSDSISTTKMSSSGAPPATDGPSSSDASHRSSIADDSARPLTGKLNTPAAILPGRSGQYPLPRWVRIGLAITTALMLIAGLGLVVLGCYGNTRNLHGLSGMNAIVTGVLLIITGVVGCAVVVISRMKSVSRWLLILFTAACHASGAFAVQCAIIAGQLISVYAMPGDCTMTEVPSQDGTVTEVIKTQCVPQTVLLVTSILILTASIVGLVLGVIQSVLCYFTAPRIWCCMCDMLGRPDTTSTDRWMLNGANVAVEDSVIAAERPRSTVDV